MSSTLLLRFCHDPRDVRLTGVGRDRRGLEGRVKEVKMEIRLAGGKGRKRKAGSKETRTTPVRRRKRRQATGEQPGRRHGSTRQAARLSEKECKNNGESLKTDAATEEQERTRRPELTRLFQLGRFS
jgi:hypothetical protein